MTIGAFPYYGSKNLLARWYAPPEYPLIVEPFAGSAAYALYHWRGHEVWLNDLDPFVVSIWRCLTSRDARDLVETYFPDHAEAGDRIDDLIPPGLPDGFVNLLRAHAVIGSPAIRKTVSPFAAAQWHLGKRRLRAVIPRVARWRVTSLPYDELPNVQAAHFIDPPYNNAAGRRYRCSASNIDYDRLAAWCRERDGQIICCENVGAQWLPFVPISRRRRGIRAQFHQVTTGEAVYERSDRHARGHVIESGDRSHLTFFAASSLMDSCA